MRFELSFSRHFSVKLMYAFNSAAIFPPGHPYIESTTVLSDEPDPTPRGSRQRLNVPLLVGVELANTLRQLFAETDSIWVYGEIFLN